MSLVVPDDPKLTQFLSKIDESSKALSDLVHPKHDSVTEFRVTITSHFGYLLDIYEGDMQVGGGYCNDAEQLRDAMIFMV